MSAYARSAAAFNEARNKRRSVFRTRSQVADSQALRDAAQDLLSSLAPVMGLFDEPAWFRCFDPDTEAAWLPNFADYMDAQSDGGYEVTAAEITQLMAQSAGASITEAQMTRLIARWNRTVTYYSLDIFYLEQVSIGWSLDFEAWDVLVLQMTELELTIERFTGKAMATHWRPHKISITNSTTRLPVTRAALAHGCGSGSNRKPSSAATPSRPRSKSSTRRTVRWKTWRWSSKRAIGSGN